MSEHKNDQEEVEKQEPLKPEKKGLSLPLIIGAAVGVLVIIVLGVVLGVVITTKFFGPEHTEETATDGKAKKEKVTKSTVDEEFDTEGGYLSKLHDIILMETGRITTNPKGAASVFVVVNFGMEFKKMDPDNDELAKLVDAKGVLDMEHPAMKKLMARMRGVLNNMLASYTQDELLSKRSELPDLVKKEMKPIFRDYELSLGNVTIQEFIIQ